ncbi:MAG TPA: sigma-54 dependent transcriptional regulator [Vicinamibacterales bacterium]|nr:sigma-54 dependent transcriptional regulator [Vicinamibacterales bacterium]HPW19231.1 sigma-54 dependent transcriptional regulator [Vicinamibacterales bacterium]
MTPGSRTILVVDDDEGMRDTLTAILRRDYRVLRAATGESALALLAREAIDVVLLDVRLPGIGGFDVLREIKEAQRLVEVIVISAINDVETAVQAMKLGAFHYITKDFEYDAVRSLVRNAADRALLTRKVMSLSAQVADDRNRPFVVGPSRSMRELLDLVRKVAALPATVLILGESGTGKELLARMIHRESGRADAPFMPVNLAAIPADLVESALFGHEKGSFTGAIRQQLGKFELADGGTLFLDEVGELRPDVQAKLLRAIQESEIERVGGSRPIRVDLRLVAATNIDLEKAVREGRFREDLYYRLKVIPMKVPPLRDRPEDLPALAQFFVGRFNAKFRKRVLEIEEPAMEALKAHSWPGNIRELENLIERLVAVSDGDRIGPADLPYEYHLAHLSRPAPGGAGLFDRACETFERSFILKALERERWNVTATARALGMPLSTLKFKMDRLDLREAARRMRGAWTGS